jgi:hypothetical protein
MAGWSRGRVADADSGEYATTRRTPSRRRRSRGAVPSYLRGSFSRPATRRQMDVLAAYVAAGGSIADAGTGWDSPAAGPSWSARHAMSKIIDNVLNIAYIAHVNDS